MLRKFNPYHEPAGSEAGGQFASDPGGGAGTTGHGEPFRADAPRIAALRAKADEGIEAVGRLSRATGPFESTREEGSWDALPPENKAATRTRYIDAYVAERLESARRNLRSDLSTEGWRSVFTDDAFMREKLRLAIVETGDVPDAASSKIAGGA